MIQPNELRIGNLIFKNHNVVDERETIYVSVQDFYWIEKYPDSYEGMPLTEEWLLKFGFEKINHIHGYSFWSHKKTKISIYDNKTEWMGYYVDNNCKYVHQLQNLFFALTGKELELKKVTF
jgi:hypothetical protein